MDMKGTLTSIARQTKATVMEKASWKLLDKRDGLEEAPSRAVITVRLAEKNLIQKWIEIFGQKSYSPLNIWHRTVTILL